MKLLKLLPLSLLLTAASCGQPAPPAADTPTTTATLPLAPMPTPPPTVSVVATAATASAVVAPVVERTTTTLPPPPSAAEVCNGLTYDFEEIENPMICFNAVAAEEGISPEGIFVAQAWIRDLIAKESGGCPFLRGGDRDLPVGCTPRTRGTHDDVGFGQATYSYYGAGGKLCKLLGVCHSSQILQSPYHSMLYSVVWPSRWDGAYGWCFYDGAGGWHNCSLVPGGSYDARKAWRLA